METAILFAIECSETYFTSKDGYPEQSVSHAHGEQQNPWPGNKGYHRTF